MKKDISARIILCCIAAVIMLAGCANDKGNAGTSAISDTTASSEITVSSDETSSVPQDENTTDLQLPTPTAKEITLSGKSEDIFEAEDDCYVIGENVVLLFQKGVTVRGDMLITTEQQMKEVETATGYTFTLKRETVKEIWHDMYFKENAFIGINEDDSKVAIGIVNMTDGAVPMTLGNSLVVDNTDYNPENIYSVLIHELVHVIQYRNTGLLGRTVDEGYAVYIQDKIVRSKGLAAWDTIQYFYDEMEPSEVINGGESSFKYQFEESNTNYQYGYRFMTFLYDSYGEQAFKDIAAEAERQKFDEGYSVENEEADKSANTAQLISIIKSKTSEDVFDRFKAWYSENWSIKEAEYKSYMKSVGADI